MGLLATDQTVNEIFGQISPPISGMPTNGATAIGSIGGFLIRLFFIIAFLAAFLYGMLGALEWISSGGEKEKIGKAQQKITNAVVGLIIIVAVIAAFSVIGGDMLGIITRDAATGGWTFQIPTLK